MKILVLHGPNLNLLGKREPEVYGADTLDQIDEQIRARAAELDAEVDCFQSNDEGELVSRIGEASPSYRGILINPAAYTHTSVALRDAMQAVDVPCVEVHLSNTAAREEFRQRSMTAPACVGSVAGFGSKSYLLGLDGLIDYIQRTQNK